MNNVLNHNTNLPCSITFGRLLSFHSCSLAHFQHYMPSFLLKSQPFKSQQCCWLESQLILKWLAGKCLIMLSNDSSSVERICPFSSIFWQAATVNITSSLDQKRVSFFNLTSPCSRAVFIAGSDHLFVFALKKEVNIYCSEVHLPPF